MDELTPAQTRNAFRCCLTSLLIAARNRRRFDVAQCALDMLQVVNDVRGGSIFADVLDASGLQVLSTRTQDAWLACTKADARDEIRRARGALARVASFAAIETRYEPEPELGEPR